MTLLNSKILIANVISKRMIKEVMKISRRTLHLALLSIIVWGCIGATIGIQVNPKYYAETAMVLGSIGEGAANRTVETFETIEVLEKILRIRFPRESEPHLSDILSPHQHRSYGSVLELRVVSDNPKSALRFSNEVTSWIKQRHDRLYDRSLAKVYKLEEEKLSQLIKSIVNHDCTMINGQSQIAYEQEDSATLGPKRICGEDVSMKFKDWYGLVNTTSGRETFRSEVILEPRIRRVWYPRAYIFTALLCISGALVTFYFLSIRNNRRGGRNNWRA